MSRSLDDTQGQDGGPQVVASPRYTIKTAPGQNGPVSTSQNGHTKIGIRYNQKSFCCNFWVS